MHRKCFSGDNIRRLTRMRLHKTLIGASIAATLAGTSSTSFAGAGAGEAGAVSIGGYGELHYNNLSSDVKDDDKKEIDFHRFVLEFGYDFTDKIRFFSEVELEHALAKDGGSCKVSDANDDNIVNVDEVSCPSKGPGEVELEQAYVEIDLSDSSSVKAGVFLIPVGLLNETHEPPGFYGVERNPIEKNIIPTTWWEGGAMYSAYTESGISYDLAIHSGLNNADGKIRSGRQKVASAAGDNLAYTARVKYTGTPGLEVAGTVQYQTDMSQGTAADAVSATLLEAHAKYSTGALTLTALYATWDVDIDTSAKTQDGSIVEASYKVNSNWGVFARQNNWSNDDGQTDAAQTDVGFNYWPHEDVVFKFDYQMQNDDAGDYDGFNLGVGYQF